MKKIDYIIYGVTSLAAMIFTGCYEVEDFNSVPENAEAPEIVSIGSHSVEFEESDANGLIYYRLSTSPDFPESETWERNEPSFNSLISNTRYYYQVVVYNDYYDIDEEHALYGEVKSFVTAQGFGNMNIYNDAKKTKIEDLFASSEKDTPLRFSYMIGGNEVPVTEAGFCFDTNADNLTKDKCAVVKKGEINEENNEVNIGSFYDSKFVEGAIIYVRPYIMTTIGTYYGERSHVFIVSGFVGDDPYIDLGLPSGNKWFACFLDYSEPINSDTQNYRYYYNTIPTGKIPDGCKVPTFEDAKELAENCTSVNRDIFGKCIEAKGPNGNIIYFPLRGYHWAGLWSSGYTEVNECGYIYLDGKYTEGYTTYQRFYKLSYKLGLYGYNHYDSADGTVSYNVRFVKD